LFQLDRFMAVADLTPNGYNPTTKNNHFTNLSSFISVANQYTNPFTKAMEGVVVVDVKLTDPDMLNLTAATLPNGINIKGCSTGVMLNGIRSRFIGGISRALRGATEFNPACLKAFKLVIARLIGFTIARVRFQECSRRSLCNNGAIIAGKCIAIVHVQKRKGNQAGQIHACLTAARNQGEAAKSAYILRAIHAGSHYARVQKGTRWIGRNQLKRSTPLGLQQPPQTYAAFPLPFHAYKRHWQ
jgi:hypothetical protein